MTATVKVTLDKYIKTVRVAQPANRSSSRSRDGVRETTAVGQQAPANDMEMQNTELQQTLKTLKNVTANLNVYSEQMIAQHREAIAKLSVEIARKILMQKVSEKDYQIESIVKEALKSTPTRQDIVVHLNPEDFSHLEQLQQNEPDSALSGVKFLSDSNIGPAECLVETPKGIVRSMIDQHLEQINRALSNAV